MNHGYEYDVNVVSPGKIIREVTFVEPDICGVPTRRQLMCQVVDTLDSMTRGALVELGWTPPKPSAPPKKCLVKGCTNTNDQGRFIGDLCAPCHDMLTSGKLRTGTTFIHDMQARLHKIIDIAT